MCIRDRGDTALARTHFAHEPRNGAALAFRVELPAVICTLKLGPAHLPERERNISVRATIEQRGGRAALRVTKEYEGLGEEGDGERPLAEIARAAHGVPVVAEVRYESVALVCHCLLYTSDAADERSS